MQFQNLPIVQLSLSVKKAEDELLSRVSKRFTVRSESEFFVAMTKAAETSL
jgi:hypothetical protein